ncbi:hypothetical protein STSO111631_17285 [Stackebrandtia soli]
MRVTAREFAARVGSYRGMARTQGIVRVSERGRPDGGYVSEAVLDELCMLRAFVAGLMDSGSLPDESDDSTPDVYGPRPANYTPRHAHPG